MQSRLYNFHFYYIFLQKNLVISKKSSNFAAEKYLTYSRLYLVHKCKHETKLQKKN